MTIIKQLQEVLEFYNGNVDSSKQGISSFLPELHVFE